MRLPMPTSDAAAASRPSYSAIVTVPDGGSRSPAWFPGIAFLESVAQRRNTWGMHQTDHLAELTRQVRSHTIELLLAAPEGWLTWAPAGTSNHLLWHAGHALWVQDRLCIEPLTGSSELPAGWAKKFGADCRPVALTRD